ncbi:hypothetical protein [Nitrosomonas sp.]|uniref:hypothetical protein n=1 Tax=Nitrosomonas sp. TaxID=42353 RepID=UPI0035B0B0C5
MAIAFKNPLSQAFGLALRKERNNSDLRINDIAYDIGIKASFLNLIEQGSSFLHVNKSALVVEAFRKSNFCLDGVMKVLMAISMMEAAAREMLDAHQDEKENSKQLYFEGLSAAIDKLSAHDEEKLGRLLSLFEINKFSRLTPKEATLLIENKELDIEVLEFLRNYETYGNLPAEAKEKFLSKRINDEIPTIYFGFITGFLNALDALPVKVSFSELWKWEDDNRCNFEELIAYVKNKEFVISKNNLRRYHYNYLWEESFTKVRFLIEGDETPSALKKQFEGIFTNLLEECVEGSCPKDCTIKNAKEKLDSLDEALNKIEFKSINNQDDRITTLMRKGISEDGYIATWIFIMNTQSPAGFMAKSVDTDKTTLVEGANLSLSETEEKYEILNDAWNLKKND